MCFTLKCTCKHPPKDSEESTATPADINHTDMHRHTPILSNHYPEKTEMFSGDRCDRSQVSLNAPLPDLDLMLYIVLKKSTNWWSESSERSLCVIFGIVWPLLCCVASLALPAQEISWRLYKLCWRIRRSTQRTRTSRWVWFSLLLHPWLMKSLLTFVRRAFLDICSADIDVVLMHIS